MKVNLSINPSLLQGIKEVCNVQKGVSVLPSDLVEATEVMAKSKRAILLFNKEDSVSVPLATLVQTSLGLYRSPTGPSW